MGGTPKWMVYGKKFQSKIGDMGFQGGSVIPSRKKYGWIHRDEWDWE